MDKVKKTRVVDNDKKKSSGDGKFDRLNLFYFKFKIK